MFILNDPFEGGTHLPDFYILKPIHVGAELVGWSASIGHQLDVGGKTPGGNGCDATEIFQEGLRIPPVRLYDRGEPAEAVFDFIDKNVRVPRQVLGDVRSQVAACLTGERGYLALLERHGAGGVRGPAPMRSSTRRSGSRGTPSRRCRTESTGSWITSTTTASIRTRSRSW